MSTPDDRRRGGSKPSRERRNTGKNRKGNRNWEGSLTPVTDKQQRFGEEYLVDLNAARMVIRAGYSPETANQQGPPLLVNVGIAETISRARVRENAEFW